MNTLKYIRVAIILLLSAVPALVQGAPLTGVTITPTDNTYGQSATYTFTFTTQTIIPADGKIAFIFPAQFNLIYLNSCGTGTPTILNGGFNNPPPIENDGTGNQTVIVARKGPGNTPVPAGSTISVLLGMVTNPLNPSSADIIAIETRNVSNGVLDTGQSSVSLAGPINSFTLSNPAGVTAGMPFSLSVSNAVDGNGNPASGTIQVTTKTGGGEAPDGTDPSVQDIVVTAGNGSAQQTLYKAESGVVLTGILSSDGSVTDDTSPFTVGSAGINSFTMTGVPTNVQAGVSFTNITVTALDVYENTVSDYTGSVWFTTTSSGYTLPYYAGQPYTFQLADNGSHTFTNFILREAGNQTLTITDGTRSTVSGNIQVNAGPIADFTFAASPSPTAGQQIRLNVTSAVDAAGNPLNVPVALSFVGGGSHSSPNGQTPVLPDNINVVNGSGYTDIVLFNAESNLQIQAVSGGITRTTAPFTVAPGNLFRFGITGYPASTVSGNPFTSDVNVTAYDVYGNQKTNYAGTVGFSSTDNSADLPSSAGLTVGTRTFSGSSFVLRTVGNQRIFVSDLSGSGVSDTTNYINVTNPAISITEITPSRTTVTQGQTTPWTVTMGVHNSGASTITISANELQTYIKFTRGGNDYTSQYTIDGPQGSFVLTGGSTTFLTFSITQTGTTTGVIDIFGRVATTTGGYTNSILSDVYGGIEVQSPEALQIVSITPSQQTVTSGDNTHNWTVAVQLRNNGGSEAGIDFASSSLASQAIVVFQRPTTFQDATTTLKANETKTMIFTVTENSTLLGAHTINAQIQYHVINTGENKSLPPANPGTVTVQAPSNLLVTSVIPTRNQLTIGSSTEWDIRVLVSNTGGSDVNLDLTQANTWVKIFSGATEVTDFDITWPTALKNTGNTTLAAGSQDELVYHVTQNSFSAGTMDILARAQGTEPNRALIIFYETSVGDGHSGTVQMQLPSNVSYVSSSLQPTSVFPRTPAEFQISVSNTGGATVELEPAQTTIQFNDAVNGGNSIFSATLDPAYGTTVAPGTTELHFQSKLVSGDFIPDSYPLQVTLNGTENGSNFQRILNLTSDLVTVGEPGDLAVTAITPSVQTITQGQQNTWYIDINVENNDVSDMRLQNMALTFNYNTQNITDQFTITYPTVLVGSGNNVLPSNTSDVLRVTINSVAANAPTGSILLSAEVQMVDVSDAGRTFTDQLFNAAQITCQSPANVQINNIYASQTTVTQGQSIPWNVTVKLTNSGESKVRLRSGSALTLSRGNQYFTVSNPTTFLGSGNNELGGGTEDSLRFVVTSVSPSVPLGAFTIFATILTEEVNTLNPLSGQSNYISLKMQENAQIRLDRIFADLRSGSLVNTNQEFYIKAQLTNPGGSNGDMVKSVTLNLSSSSPGFTFPNGTTVTIDSIDAGQTKTSEPGILVRASNLSNVRTVINANMTSAVARNTGLPAQVLTPLSNSTEITTQTPGNLVVQNVIAQEDTIVSGTLAPWTIKVAIINSGVGTLLLKKPQDSDVSINREGYVIKADPVWTDSLLIGGELDTLVYTVTNTPSASGVFTITANIQAEDYNDSSIGVFTKSGQTQVYFTKTSAVGITETYMDPATPNVDANGVGHVNITQVFNVRVKIENKADQALDSVRVKLLAPNSLVSSQILITNIGFGEDKEGVFTVQAADVENLVGETLRSEIVYAYGRDGTQSKISPAQDDSVEIKIYYPARLQIVSTENLAPNPEKKVSQGQNFPVEVKVANLGSETAKEIRVSLATSSAQHATVLETPMTIDETIAGGDTGTVVFTLKAGNNTAAGLVSIYSNLFDAKGENNNQQPAFLEPGDNDSTYADLEKGADLLILNLIADVENNEIIANYSQSPWNLNIELFNGGEADLEIVNLNNSNISFTVDGQPDNTYDVRPPSKLKHAGDLILRAGQTDTLAFSIAENGEIAGNAVVKAQIFGRDMNIGPASNLTAIDSTDIYVISEAVVQIVETSINSNVHDNDGKGLVNRGQNFVVSVLVRAGQLLGVDSVLIQLTTNGNSMSEPDTFQLDSINRDSEIRAIFNLQADDSWPEIQGEQEEMFTAKILSALSKNSQLPARIRPPDKTTNAQANLRIQRSANLKLSLLYNSPLDSVLTLGQQFDIIARIHNLGTAQVDIGKVQLTPPTGYEIKLASELYSAEPVERQFTIEDGEEYKDVLFTFRAPNANSAKSKIKGKISQIPLDRNTNSPAAILQSADSLYVRTSSSSLNIHSFTILKPQGAKDFELSTEQPLTLQAVITSTSNLQYRKARLKFPDNLPGDVIYTLNNSDAEVDITSNPDTISWQLNAPSVKFENVHKFYVDAEAVEAGKTKTVTDSLSIYRVVNRANIAIEFFEAVNEFGTIKQEREAYFSKFQQNIILRARIKNQGDANITGTGKLKLDLGQSGLTLTSEYQGLVEQNFTQETEDIIWKVNAGPINNDGFNITVEISQAPNDENTNETAKTADDASKRTMRVWVTELGKVRIVNKRAWISSPIGAVDNIVSTDQTFTVKTEVNSDNVDKNRITARLVAPEAFRVIQSTQNVTLGFNREVTWEVTAPSDASLSDSLKVLVTGYDDNSGLESKDSSNAVFIRTVPKTSFKIDPKITYPDSFQESVSTGQEFSLTATILHQGASYIKADSFIVELNSPKEFTRIDDKRQIFKFAQFEKGLHPTWRLNAPTQKPAGGEFSNFTINLLEVPRDENSYIAGEVKNDSVTHKISVVDRALTKTDAYLLGQVNADTGNVRIGSEFNVVLRLTNLGFARFIDNYRVKIHLPANGYTTQDAEKTGIITNGMIDSLVWKIKAPNTINSNLDIISFTLLDPPNDQYAKTNAAVLNNEAHVRVKLETGKLIAETYPVRTKSAVIKGGKNVPILGLVFRNKDVSSKVNSYLTKLFLTIRDREGEIINPSTAVNRIAAVRHSDYDHIFAQTTDFSVTDKPGQVMLNFRTLKIDTIRSAQRDTVDIIVDVSEFNETDFKISLSDSLPIYAVDDNGQLLDLANANGETMSYVDFESLLAVVVEGEMKKAFYNYPNPFGRNDKPTTNFIYYLEQDSALKLQIFTLTGDLVKKWEFQSTDPEGAAGLHQGEPNLIWDGRNGKGEVIMNGVYLAYLTLEGGNTASTKIVFVK
ncbi:hypothetical protein JXQ31_07915 [candidate division KSB1 bacterium]|nr:hypothetical protein [candidate division KSB1 bacterium]